MADEVKKVSVGIQKHYAPLLYEKKRYKLYYGGRAGGKSYGFADCLLLRGRKEKLVIACVREVQNSIKDSVKRLLEDRISKWGYTDYAVYEDRIDNIETGTRIIFKGLRNDNAQNIKSLEGVNICWIEEGQTISKDSWDILDPTIRKEDSEIWISMNRQEENDPIWKAVGANPDDRTIVKRVNYTDNVYCPENMKYLAEKCKQENYDDWLHTWWGEPVQQGDKKLISYKEVHRALENNFVPAVEMPLIIGIDIARFGDDKTAVARRRGRQAFKIQTYKSMSIVETANLCARIINEEQPLRLNLDAGGVGGGVYDILLDRGYGQIVRGVNFAEKAQEIEKYGNRRAEMWDRVHLWLTSELPVSLVDCDGLCEDLTAPNKKYDSLGRLLIEAKEDIKKRLGRSTDVADALALTFAEMSYPSSLLRYENEDYVDDNVYVG